MEIIDGDLFIFYDTSYEEFVDTISNRFLLVFGFPLETVLFNFEDLFSECIKVSLDFPGLNFEEQEGLGDNTGLATLGLSGSSGFLFSESLLSFL